MEISKQELLNLFEQSHENEMGEMASKVEHGYESKGRSKYDVIKNNQGVVVGYNVNDFKTNQKLPVLYVDNEDELKQFIDTHPEVIQQIKQKYPNTPLRFTIRKGGVADLKHPPRSRNVNIKPIPGEEGDEMNISTLPLQHEKRSAGTTIKRLLHQLLYYGNPQFGFEGFANDRIEKRLERLSIPSFNVREREHLDTHGTTSNELIQYATHNFNYYSDVQNFIKAVMARVTNKPLEAQFKSGHLARQSDHLKTRKWAETKKQMDDYKGKTEIYKLDALGLDPDKNGVAVKSILSIKGELRNGEFRWEVNLSVKFGKKLKDETLGGLEPIDNIRIVKFADTNRTYDDNFTVMDDPNIYSALVDAFKELEDVIFNDLKPIRLLDKGNSSQSQLAENKKNELVDKIIQKLKK